MNLQDKPSNQTRYNPQKIKKINEGILIIEEWIIQLFKQGFDVLQKDQHRLIEISTRMVDYGLPAIARKIRILPEKIIHESDWIDVVAQEIGELYLLCQSFKKFEVLDINKQEDLLSFVGVPIKKTDIKSYSIPISDQWVYLGTINEKEEQILISRNWFYGIQYKKFALLLDFQVNKFTKLRSFIMGKMYLGDVHFYPGTVPLRVTEIPETFHTITENLPYPRYTISAFLTQYNYAISLNPWLKMVPCILSHCSIIELNQAWYVMDENKDLLPLKTHGDTLWSLLAWSSIPNTLFIGEFNNNQFHILSVYSDNLMIKI
jgi:hypothetical protein